MEKNVRKLIHLWHIVKITNIHLMEVPEEKSREIRPKLLEKITTRRSSTNSNELRDPHLSTAEST